MLGQPGVEAAAVHAPRGAPTGAIGVLDPDHAAAGVEVHAGQRHGVG